MADLALRLAGAADPAEPAVGAHHHDVERVGREIPVDAAALRHVADQIALLGVGLAEDLDRPGGDRHQPHRRLDQRRLARRRWDR